MAGTTFKPGSVLLFVDGIPGVMEELKQPPRVLTDRSGAGWSALMFMRELLDVRKDSFHQFYCQKDFNQGVRSDIVLCPVTQIEWVGGWVIG